MVHSGRFAAETVVRLAGADVLVTGTSGFVGAAVGRRLRALGASVTGLSRSPPRDGACDRHVRHDLASPLPDDLPRFDAIVHCAALASPWAKLSAYRLANVVGLERMLAFAQRRPPERFVFLSSSAVHYSWGDTTEVTETTPWPGQAINAYARSKRLGEAMVRKSDLPWTIVRPRAVYGPGDTVVFPRILHAARAGVLPDLIRFDGVVPRADLLFVENLAAYVGRILEVDAGGVFLLTDGSAVEIPAMLREVLSALGLPGPKRRVPVAAALAAAGAMELASVMLNDWREPAATRFGVSSLGFSRTFDISRALECLGPAPFTREHGMAAFIDWQRKQMS